MASADVRPGLSMPSRFTRPLSPWSVAVSMRKSGCGSGAVQFRHAVVGHQGAIGQAGPVVANGGIERRRACGVHRVVDAVYPLDVGTETHALAEIERGVNPEAGCVWHRVDKMPERRTRRHREIVAACQVHGGNGSSIPVDVPEQHCVQACLLTTKWPDFRRAVTSRFTTKTVAGAHGAVDRTAHQGAAGIYVAL